MRKTFAIGDIVTWRSQASGVWKQKTGKVVEVVPEYKIPHDKGFGSSRNHESYIVEVTFEPKHSAATRVKKPERYWPRVSNLSKVGGDTLVEILTVSSGAQANVESMN